jgi:precorrin-6B C5,15-methyltransferase / cobalt-precorrin-6B C5,C15-methyltransferase
VSAAESKIHIIGLGSDGMAGLTSRAREWLNAAQIVLGSEQALQLLPDLKARKVRIGADLQEVVGQVESLAVSGQRVVIVAGGDPLFYGVARYLCDRLGKERFEVLPHVSSMQLAFARIKETWEEAYLTNLATHPLADVLDRIRTAETVGMFTSDQHSPAKIARELLSRGIDYFRAYVCENLGAPNERVTQGELSEIAEMEFAPLNVMILRRKPGRPDQPRRTGRRRFGNPDDAFAQSRPKSGLVTQAEVRAIALAQLDIHPGMVVWDVGAGSGSVSIEAAELAQPGMVFAIEQDAADYHLILANADTFAVKNLKAVHATAPAIFADLPKPDAIFIGGTGREVARLLEAAYKALRPGGRLVVNVATLEMLNATYSTLRALAGGVEVLLVNVARGTEQLETLRFEAVNPTFLLCVGKA